MTKKDYILAARIIRESRATRAAKADLRDAFAAFFAADNPHFDLERWREAVDDGTVRARAGTTPRPDPGVR